MQILSWNIQATKGVDNISSSKRIAGDIKAFCDADVICLQEVLRVTGNDQVEELARFFPDYEIYFGPAINRLHTAGRLGPPSVITKIMATSTVSGLPSKFISGKPDVAIRFGCTAHF